MRMLLVVALLAIATPARAQLWLQVTGVSKHSESGYCEVNPGLGLHYEFNDDWSVMAGRFRNSLCRPSNALGVCYHPLHLGAVSAGVCGMRLTGYDDKPVYAPVPTLSIRMSKSFAIDLIGGAKDGESVIGAGVRFLIN